MIKLLKKYRGDEKGAMINPEASELGWLEQFGYIDKDVVDTTVSTEPKKRNTRRSRKPKGS